MVKVSFLSTAMAFLFSTGISVGGPAPVHDERSFPLMALDGITPVSEHRSTAYQSVDRAADGLFYVNGRIDGTSIRFVVDTGSNVVILAQRDAARLGGIRTTRRAIDVQTAGGPSAMSSKPIRHLLVAGQSIDDVDEVFVDPNLKVSLLGQSALSKLSSLRLAGDRLDLN